MATNFPSIDISIEPGIKVSRQLLPWGDLASGTTANAMVEIIRDSIDKPIVKDTAYHIIQRNKPVDRRGYAFSILGHIKDCFRYVPGTIGFQEFTAPWIHCSRVRKLGYTYGICTDLAGYTASIGRAVGIVSRLRLVATGKQGEKFDHVACDFFLDTANPVKGKPAEKIWFSMDILFPKLKPIRTRTVEI